MKWHCDQVTWSDPWAWDWVAINIDEAEDRDDPQPWTLAMEPPSEHGGGRSREADPLFAFEWAPDLSLHRVIEPRALLPRTIAEHLSPAGDTLGETESAEFAAYLCGNCLWRYEVVPAWSVQSINAGLAHWACIVLQRPDLVFEWDSDAGPSRLMAWAKQRTKEAMTQEHYPSGIPGVSISDGAMDDLLKMGPDGAADTMEFLRDLAADSNRHHPHGA